MKLMIWLVLVAQAFACGVERWSVKTLADYGASQIDLSPTDTTIAQLRALTPPADLKSNPDKRDPNELKVWRLHASLVAFKHEADGDYHLVLSDGGERGARTMIAEIPDPVCVPQQYRATFASERSWLQRQFGGSGRTGHLKRLSQPAPIVISGVGFFDFLHGQTGVAPNGIELHPVMTIEREWGNRQLSWIKRYQQRATAECLEHHSPEQCKPLPYPSDQPRAWVEP